MGSLYPVGRYWGRVVSQALGQASTGTTQFQLRFELLGRIVPGEAGEDALADCEPGERTVYLAITDATIEFVTRDLLTIGYDKSSLRFLDPNVEGFHDFTGYECGLYCSHDSYQGVAKEKWRLNTRKVEVKPPDPKALRGLDVLFGKALKEVSASVKKAAPEAATGAPKGNGSRKAPEVKPEPAGARDANTAFQEAVEDEGPSIPF